MDKEELENKIKNLEEELKNIKSGLEKNGKIKRRKPKNGELYWIVDSDNNVKDILHWDDDDYDTDYYNNYNCFLTEEEAEKVQRIKETENMLRRYVEEHDEVELDWENSLQRKWNLVYNFEKKEIYCDYDYSFKHPRTIYASSDEILQEAVKEIGEARIEEYTQN